MKPFLLAVILTSFCEGGLGRTVFCTKLLVGVGPFMPSIPLLRGVGAPCAPLPIILFGWGRGGTGLGIDGRTVTGVIWSFGGGVLGFGGRRVTLTSIWGSLDALTFWNGFINYLGHNNYWNPFIFALFKIYWFHLYFWGSKTEQPFLKAH